MVQSGLAQSAAVDIFALTIGWRRLTAEKGALMGDKGKKDKGQREKKKQSKVDPKEKRRLKREKREHGEG